MRGCVEMFPARGDYLWDGRVIQNLKIKLKKTDDFAISTKVEKSVPLLIILTFNHLHF